jgi:hypothetical protein
LSTSRAYAVVAAVTVPINEEPKINITAVKKTKRKEKKRKKIPEARDMSRLEPVLLAATVAVVVAICSESSDMLNGPKIKLM